MLVLAGGVCLVRLLCLWVGYTVLVVNLWWFWFGFDLLCWYSSQSWLFGIACFVLSSDLFA